MMPKELGVGRERTGIRKTPRMVDFTLGGNGAWLDPEMQVLRGMSELDMRVVFGSQRPEETRARTLEPMDRFVRCATFAYHPVVAGNYPTEPFGSCILATPSVIPSSLKGANAWEFLITLQEEYKRKGIGLALIEHSLGVAAKNNIDVIFGAVDFSNTGMDLFCSSVRAVDSYRIHYTPDLRMGTNILIIPTDEEVRAKFEEKLKGIVYEHK